MMFAKSMLAGLGAAGWVIGFVAALGVFLIGAGILMLLCIEVGKAIDVMLGAKDKKEGGETHVDTDD